MGPIFAFKPPSARFVSNEVFSMKIDVSNLSYSQIMRIADSLPMAIEQISSRGDKVSLVVGNAVC